MSSNSDLIVRYFAFPFIIGIIGAVLSAFIQRQSYQWQKKREMRQMQLEKAIEICHRIVDQMDKLFNLMKHEAWPCAWRKARSTLSRDDLLERDAAAWQDYLDNLRIWRTTSICNDVEIKAYFGDGLEAEFLVEIDELFELAAKKIWNIYYELASEGKELTIEDEARSSNEFDAIFAQMKEKITEFSSTMINCIQGGLVGTLRGLDNGSSSEVDDSSSFALWKRNEHATKRGQERQSEREGVGRSVVVKSNDKTANAYARSA